MHWLLTTHARRYQKWYHTTGHVWQGRIRERKGRSSAMPRVPRQQQHSAAASFPVMNRGHNREVVFRDAEDHTSFLHLLDRYRRRFHVLDRANGRLAIFRQDAERRLRPTGFVS